MGAPPTSVGVGAVLQSCFDERKRSSFSLKCSQTSVVLRFSSGFHANESRLDQRSRPSMGSPVIPFVEYPSRLVHSPARRKSKRSSRIGRLIIPSKRRFL